MISSLFDDLSHLCTSCAVRLKQKEEFDRHMEMHDKKLELSGTKSKCRVWFPKAEDWIAAKPEYEEVLSEPESVVEDGPSVDADENQYACISCGERCLRTISGKKWLNGCSRELLTLPLLQPTVRLMDR